MDLLQAHVSANLPSMQELMGITSQSMLSEMVESVLEKKSLPAIENEVLDPARMITDGSIEGASAPAEESQVAVFRRDDDLPVKRFAPRTMQSEFGKLVKPSRTEALVEQAQETKNFKSAVDNVYNQHRKDLAWRHSSPN